MLLHDASVVMYPPPVRVPPRACVGRSKPSQSKPWSDTDGEALCGGRRKCVGGRSGGEPRDARAVRSRGGEIPRCVKLFSRRTLFWSSKIARIFKKVFEGDIFRTPHPSSTHDTKNDFVYQRIMTRKLNVTGLKKALAADCVLSLIHI